jgi:hypothetical protein
VLLELRIRLELPTLRYPSLVIVCCYEIGASHPGGRPPPTPSIGPWVKRDAVPASRTKHLSAGLVRWPPRRVQLSETSRRRPRPVATATGPGANYPQWANADPSQSMLSNDLFSTNGPLRTTIGRIAFCCHGMQFRQSAKSRPRSRAVLKDVPFEWLDFTSTIALARSSSR